MMIMLTTLMATMGIKEILIVFLIVCMGMSIIRKLIKLAFFLASVAVFVRFGLPYFQEAMK